MKGMDAYQWLLFLCAHTERHLAQIREVKANAGFPKSSNCRDGGRWLEREVSRAADLIAASARKDTRKPFSTETFSSPWKFMRELRANGRFSCSKKLPEHAWEVSFL
jgi:hypothetical protein